LRAAFHRSPVGELSDSLLEQLLEAVSEVVSFEVSEETTGTRRGQRAGSLRDDESSVSARSLSPRSTIRSGSAASAIAPRAITDSKPATPRAT